MSKTKILIVLLFSILSASLSYSDDVLEDGITNELLTDLKNNIFDNTGKSYIINDYNYFVADSTDTLKGATGKFLSIRPSENGAKFKSNAYLLNRITLFLEATGSLKTLTDTVTIFITNSNSDSVWNSASRLVWGPFTVAGEDCTASTIGTTAAQGAVQFNLSPICSAAAQTNAMNARLASYPHKWKHVVGNSYGQHPVAGAGQDTVAGAAGIKVLFRDIQLVPPVLYKASSESDSIIYIQARGNLLDATNPDSIAMLTVRVEGYKVEIK